MKAFRIFVALVVGVFGFFWVLDVTGNLEDSDSAARPPIATTAPMPVPTLHTCERLHFSSEESRGECYAYHNELWERTPENRYNDWEGRDDEGGRCYPVSGCE